MKMVQVYGFKFWDVLADRYWVSTRMATRMATRQAIQSMKSAVLMLDVTVEVDAALIDSNGMTERGFCEPA